MESPNKGSTVFSSIDEYFVRHTFVAFLVLFVFFLALWIPTNVWAFEEDLVETVLTAFVVAVAFFNFYAGRKYERRKADERSRAE